MEGKQQHESCSTHAPRQLTHALFTRMHRHLHTHTHLSPLHMYHGTHTCIVHMHAQAHTYTYTHATSTHASWYSHMHCSHAYSHAHTHVIKLFRDLRKTETSRPLLCMALRGLGDPVTLCSLSAAHHSASLCTFFPSVARWDLLFLTFPSPAHLHPVPTELP